MIPAARERIRQFLGANGTPTPAELAFAEAWLTPGLLQVFLRQHPRDIVHGVRTAQWLVGRGQGDGDLVVAGLLHDVGKGEQRRWDRVAYVVAGWLGLAPRLGSRRSRFQVRRAVYRSVHHSERGAEILDRAGAPQAVIALTQRHHGSAGCDGMLALLQQADAES